VIDGDRCICDLPIDILGLIFNKCDFGSNRRDIGAVSVSCKTFNAALVRCPARITFRGSWKQTQLAGEVYLCRPALHGVRLAWIKPPQMRLTLGSGVSTCARLMRLCTESQYSGAPLTFCPSCPKSSTLRHLVSSASCWTNLLGDLDLLIQFH